MAWAGQAQGIIYLSNFGQVSVGSEPVGNNSWLAADFRTGVNAGGFLLNSIQLAMTTDSGNPTGFTVMIYSSVSSGAVLPESSLDTLSGSANPSATGIYTYTSLSDIILLPSTHYFIVLTAATPTANGAYQWSVTDTPTVTFNGWSANNLLCYSGNGSNWSFLSGTLAQYSITATPVPEPSISWLLVLGGSICGFVRKRNHYSP